MKKKKDLRKFKNNIHIFGMFVCKAELLQVGIFFHTQFSSLGIFINKEVGNQKKKLRSPSIKL